MPLIIADARPAPLMRHLAAIAYDVMLLAACWIGVGFIFIIFNKGEAITGGALHYLLQAALLATWLAFYLYFWTRQGQTLGMRAWRLAVADENGRPLTTVLALKRWCCALLTCAPAGIGLWWRYLDVDGCTLYDRLSRTRLYLLPTNPYPSAKKRKTHV